MKGNTAFGGELLWPRYFTSAKPASNDAELGISPWRLPEIGLSCRPAGMALACRMRKGD